jgi:hypothetical protein
VHITGTRATQGPAAFGTSTSPLLQCTCLSMSSCEYLPMFAVGPSFSATNRRHDFLPHSNCPSESIPTPHRFSQFQVMMMSSPLGIDSTLLSISPCNLQAHKSQHPYLLNQVFRSNVLDFFFPHKLYHYLTHYISRNKDFVMDAIKLTHLHDSVVYNPVWDHGTSKKVSGFKPEVFFPGELSPDF